MGKKKKAFKVLDLGVFTELNKNSLLGQSAVDSCAGTDGFYLKTRSSHMLHLAAAESSVLLPLCFSCHFQASEIGAKHPQQHQ